MDTWKGLGMKNNEISHQIKKIEKRLHNLETEKQTLLSELTALKQSSDENTTAYLGIKASKNPPETPEEKINLFLKLFRCREEVFPRFWENTKSGKKGYSPVCGNEWKRSVCFKPKVKCSDCKNQSFIPFDSKIAKKHLTGKIAIGSYAINIGDKCIFLAADFDKSAWREDIWFYKNAAEKMSIQVSIEISKSGNGAHAWIFFAHPVSAKQARMLGDFILTSAMDYSEKYNLNSYDRFFPNQDYLPAGGFGNLIALPLQKDYRDNNRSVFVDDKIEPYPDQWEYLSNIFCLTDTDLNTILSENMVSNEAEFQNNDIDNDLSIAESILKKEMNSDEQFNGTIKIVLGGQAAILIKSLPKKILGILRKMATIANPKFFENQKKRFSTWNIPKYIFYGENDKKNIYLPRGLFPEIKSFLTDQGFDVVLNDERNINDKIEISFKGKLYDHQIEAVDKLQKYENAVLVAPTGTGKTIIAIKRITELKAKTLILVHRSTLIEQWIDSICGFIPEIDKKDIGVLGSGRKKLKGKIDIAMLQSLANIEDLSTLTEGYDFLIIDECHRIPTVTFEPVMKAIKVKHILGLTATPHRKDHFQSIIFFQCGPIRHIVEDVNRENQTRNVYFRSTDVPDLGRNSSIQELWEALLESDSHNDMIIEDALELLQENKSPLILSDRIEHIEILTKLLSKQSEIKTFVLKGGLPKKERQNIIADCKQMLQEQKPFCLFATGSLIGEGFDLPGFDTIQITLPISFKGRLTQYVGRLHRQSSLEHKTITVYDYVDTCSGMTISMFKKRIPAYKKLVYNYIYEANEKIARWL